MTIDIKDVAEKINSADAILIGASNGLSITEGIHLFANNYTFQTLFGDYQKKYGLPNLLYGMMVKWPTEQEKWGFWSRLVEHFYNNYEPSETMKDLRNIVGDKNYFVVTSNGEQHFEKSGFDDDKVFEIEGDWLHFQCSHGCHDKRYSWAELAHVMALEQIDGKVPLELIPKCSKCGSPMIPNMAAGSHFIPKTKIQENYKKFLQENHKKNIVILELGIGWKNQLIKAPFMEFVAKEPNATYITINLGEIYILDNIKDKSFGINGSLDKVLHDIRKCIELIN